jgi:hypothetical protein
MPLTKNTPLQPGDPRLIVQWAQRYARSRTINFLVQWVFIVAMVTAVAAAAVSTHMTWQAGNMGLFSVSTAFMVIAIIALSWFSLSPWGGELIWRITQWLYGREGYVAYPGDRKDGPAPAWLTLLGGGLIVFHLAGALLVSFRMMGFYWMQPFSALYMCPYLIIMIRYQELGFWAWIWPILYGLHAIAMGLGLPVYFTGQWQLFNMILPVFGYGLAAIIAGHVFSRFALWKLKRLSRGGLEDAPAEEDGEAETEKANGEDAGEARE